VRRAASDGHTVAVYHRGQTRAALPDTVRQILDPLAVMPLETFPAQLFEFEPDVVVHTIAMGAIDSAAAMSAFAGRTGRLVLLSSGDVYRAYGRLTRIEPGPLEEGLLFERAPLRSVLFPYRKSATSLGALEYWYEKILAEHAVLTTPALPGTVLRLPKVYGPAGNEDLATVYRYRHQPNWRWTHGFVENVAAAVVLAAVHPSAAGRVYNVGEACTPTVAERLRGMPQSPIEPDLGSPLNFAQDIAYDTSRIRNELGYREIVSEEEALHETLRARSN
jgi:nucleoside-diphosphate-sugar epimerase